MTERYAFSLPRKQEIPLGSALVVCNLSPFAQGSAAAVMGHAVAYYVIERGGYYPYSFALHSGQFPVAERYSQRWRPPEIVPDHLGPYRDYEALAANYDYLLIRRKPDQRLPWLEEDPRFLQGIQGGGGHRLLVVKLHSNPTPGRGTR